MAEHVPMSEAKSEKRVRPRATICRIGGLILLVALVVSWFVWGPLGIVFYVGGLFNSTWTFMLARPLFGLLILAAICPIALAIDMALHRRTLSSRQKVHRLLLGIVAVAFVISVALGFGGLAPSPFDMHVKGFARYARNRVDVAAIQGWLETLDSSEYIGEHGDPGGIPILPAEHPPAIAKLRPNGFPHGVRVLPDNAGRLMVRLAWGGGMIGHWGIVVGPKEMETPQTQEPAWVERQSDGGTEEYYEYGERRTPLAPGAYIWAELE